MAKQFCCYKRLVSYLQRPTSWGCRGTSRRYRRPGSGSPAGYPVQNVVVVYHVTIVAIGHGLLKKFWPMVIGCVLRMAGSYSKLCRPAYFVRITQLLPHPGHGFMKKRSRSVGQIKLFPLERN